MRTAKSWMLSGVASVMLALLSVAEAPAQECNQNHDHNALPWPLSQCDWEGQLNWSAGDTGFNEGAEKACNIARATGIGIPGPAGQLVCAAIGNLWTRREVMALAKDTARAAYASGNLALASAAGDMAIATQWHNCHALRCLAFHKPEVIVWLARH